MKNNAQNYYYKMFSKFRKKFGTVFPATWYELDWVNSWNFDLDIKFEEPHSMNTFRRYFLAQVSKFAEESTASGDFIEFGVYNGFGSYLMLNNSNRFLHLVDSFEGLSQPGVRDGKFWNSGDMSRSVETVNENLKEFNGRFKIWHGFIPEILEDIDIENVALAHVDVDLYSPTIESLEWTYSKLTYGGLILCDDYGFSTCPGATLAIDEFCKNHLDLYLLRLPVGGAIIHKRSF